MMLYYTIILYCIIILNDADFPHDQAQFEILKLIGDSHVQLLRAMELILLVS
jgi:hypothetical protein